MRPSISVLISVYNGEDYIKESLDSILAQSFSNFECIIVDDGSSDSSRQMITYFQKKDPRIMPFYNAQNLGLTKSLNIGLKKCTGKYIARMDADDVCEFNRFRCQFDFLERNPDLALCGTLGWYIDEHGKKTGEKNLPLTYEEIKKKILHNNQFIHSSLFIKTEVLKKEGGYDEAFKTSQDYELIMRLAAKYRVVNLPDRLISWRVKRDSLSWVSKRQEYDAIRVRLRAILTYGYPTFSGLLYIILRLLWLLLPQKFKIRRYM